MKKIVFAILILCLSVTILADELTYEKRVKESMELIKQGEIEAGLTKLMGEGTLLYNSIFNVPTNKNNQLTQLQNFQNVYGKIIDLELVWSKRAGKVTNQLYMIYHKNYPMVLDITFYKIDGEISVIKYKFEESAEEIPALL